MRVTGGELVVDLGQFTGQPGICDTNPAEFDDAYLTFTAETVELISSTLNG